MCLKTGLEDENERVVMDIERWKVRKGMLAIEARACLGVVIIGHAKAMALDNLDVVQLDDNGHLGIQVYQSYYCLR